MLESTCSTFQIILKDKPVYMDLKNPAGFSMDNYYEAEYVLCPWIWNELNWAIILIQLFYEHA